MVFYDGLAESPRVGNTEKRKLSKIIKKTTKRFHILFNEVKKGRNHTKLLGPIILAQGEVSCLKDEALKNMDDISVTEEISHVLHKF